MIQKVKNAHLAKVPSFIGTSDYDFKRKGASRCTQVQLFSLSPKVVSTILVTSEYLKFVLTIHLIY